MNADSQFPVCTISSEDLECLLNVVLTTITLGKSKNALLNDCFDIYTRAPTCFAALIKLMSSAALC